MNAERAGLSESAEAVPDISLKIKSKMNKSVRESSRMHKDGIVLVTEEFMYCCDARILLSIIKKHTDYTNRLDYRSNDAIKRKNMKKEACRKRPTLLPIRDGQWTSSQIKPDTIIISES